MVQDEQGLWSFGPHPEPWLVEELAHNLAMELHPNVQVAVPLAIGDHTDHRLVRFAAQALGRPLWYYPDAPYAMRAPDASVFYASARRVKPKTLTAPALRDLAGGSRGLCLATQHLLAGSQRAGCGV